ncbi:PREDICTED: uncharacterized protein LOC104810560 isoform X2 [Tarenaya hassleriana]|uniref:uncharacterized protein LOC104810560 isoform X2 n=1 Tax=Tarenaya hassleriana TaxID=28532 RepID=UPI00053C2917|nr:PREDICTED: uncharacterized protein LOC104810560 isoform X2 [Tarenaya hassleriana]
MYGGSSKLGRGGGRGGAASGGPSLVRNSYRNPSLVGRMSSGGGGASAPRQSSTSGGRATATPQAVEETFSLVPSKNLPAFAMIIRLAPDLVEDIRRVEAQGETAKIKFGASSNNTSGNIINVGGKEFKFTWSRELGDLCDIYEEHQSGEDGEGVLIEAGCAWRKLNVQRTLDESTTNHMKMRSVEAEQRTKSRKAIVLDPGNPSLTKQLALAEANPWRMLNKQKKEQSHKKWKIEPPPVPIGGPRPALKPGASTTASKVQAKGKENPVVSEKDPSTRATNALWDTSGNKATNIDKPIDLQTMLINLLKDAPMSLEALEKAVGDKIPNAAKKFEPVLKKIADVQASGRYFLKSGAELESNKKLSPETGSSPEDQQLCLITECSHEQSPVLGAKNVENISVCEPSGKYQQDDISVHPEGQSSSPENVDIERLSPGILGEEKPYENGEDQAGSSGDSASDSDGDSESDSESSSDSEPSSNSKEGSDVDVDIMSDDDRQPRHTIESAEIGLPASTLPSQTDFCAAGLNESAEKEGDDGFDAYDIAGHDSDAVDIEGNDSDAVDIDRPRSGSVGIDGHSSDEGHGSDGVRTFFPDNNCKLEPITANTSAANEDGRDLGWGHFSSDHDKIRERHDFIGRLFDDTENIVKDSFDNEQSDSPEMRARGNTKRGPDLEHFNQKSERVKRMKAESMKQFPTMRKEHVQPPEGMYDLSPTIKVSANHMVDPVERETDANCDPGRGPSKAFIEKSNSDFPPFSVKISKSLQIKPTDGKGRSNKHIDSSGNVRKSAYSHEILSNRTGKVSGDSKKDSNHPKDRFLRNKKDGESARQLALPSEGPGKKHGKLEGNGKDAKNVSGLSSGSSPFDNQRTSSPNFHVKGNGSMLQKVVSDLEVGELREPLGEDTAAKQLERKSSFRQSDDKPSTSVSWDLESDKRKPSKKSNFDSKKLAPTHTGNVIKGMPGQGIEDSARSHKWGLLSHAPRHSGSENNETGSQYGQLEEKSNKSRPIDSGTRPGSSVGGYGETIKKASTVAPQRHGSKRGSVPRSSRESKRHASGATANSVNGQNDTGLIPSDGVGRKKRETSFDEEDSAYLKYEKASPELKGPVSDHSQYKAYIQEYQEKYGSYCSLNKILENYRNEFQKMGENLEFTKGRDVEMYNKILQQLKGSYRKYGERQKRLMRIFVVLHEELKNLKKRMKDYASSRGNDRSRHVL